MNTYQNPILYVDYSDPDAIRVGEDYFMTASSFCNVPGLPLLHSRDLVNWKLIGYALDRIPEFRYREPIHGCGVWAPAIRYHDGKFYICFPMPDEGLYMVTARDPQGEWTKPVKIYDGAGLIDPCPFWDEDGKAYLVCGVAKSRIGYKSVLHLFEMRPDGMELLSGPVKIYDGTLDGNTTTEGPKLYKRNGYYYIFAPAGGVKTGWQIVLRSRNIYGPYEARTVMRQGKTGVNGPHQGAWVTDTEGKDWFLHFQDVFAAGRITHLQPMAWREDGWPVIGRPTEEDPSVGEPVLVWEKPGIMKDDIRKEQEKSGGICRKDDDGDENCGNVRDGLADEKGNPALPWQWNANPGKDWIAKTLRKGEDELALMAAAVSEQRPLCDYPNLLLRKWEAPKFSVETCMEIDQMAEGGFAGMMSMGTVYGGLGILREKNGFYAVKVTGEQVFDGGAVYAKERKEKAEILEELRNVRFLLEIVPVNEVTAVSPKPEYTEGQEGKVLHPESKVRIVMKVAEGKELMRMEIPARAGRWVGNKFGFFYVEMNEKKVSKKEEKGIALLKKYKYCDC